MLKDDSLDEHQKKLVAEKRQQYEKAIAGSKPDDANDFPEGAQLCIKCNTKAAIQMDGCLTCLNCGESKCG